MKIFSNFRFRTKIILVCVMILLLNSIICGSLYYNYAYKDTLKNYASSSEDLVTQMQKQLSSETQFITRRVHAMFNNLSFYTPMSQYLRDAESVYLTTLLGNISDVISEFDQGDDFIHSVSIETESGSFDNFTMIRNHDFNFKESPMYEFFAENPNETIRWYPASKALIFRSNEEVIPVVYRFRIERKNVFVVIHVSQRELKKFLKQTYSSYDKIFIADRDKENVLNCGEAERKLLDFLSEEEQSDRMPFCREVKLDGKKYLATYTVMSGTGWKICALKSLESTVGNLEQLRYFIVIVVGICALICVAAIILIAHGITVPLGKLSAIMNQVTRTEDFQSQFAYPYRDEVGDLSTSFNYMIQKINQLVGALNAKIEELREEKEHVKQVQEQKRKAELKALQAQINPHFLYNTLNTITWQAADQGMSEVSTLSSSLGKFFRISLSKGREIITLREELEHAASYLKIQTIRYKEKIQYEFHVPEDVKNLYIIKLVLQPLVENSIYHGIKKKKGTGHICISVQRKMSDAGIPVLWICVEDDGEGIEEERLAVLNHGLTTGVISRDTGYGIYNVNERLRLYYGTAYGLKLESDYRKGTRATIVIPVQTTEES